MTRLDEYGVSIPRQELYRLEAGKRRVRIDELLAIAAALNVAPLHLIVPFEGRRDADELGATWLKVGAYARPPANARRWFVGLEPFEPIYDDPRAVLRFFHEEVPPRVDDTRERLRNDWTAIEEAIQSADAERREKALAAAGRLRNQTEQGPTWIVDESGIEKPAWVWALQQERRPE